VLDARHLRHAIAGGAGLHHADDAEGHVLAGLELGLDVLEHLLCLVAGPGLEDGGGRVLPDEGVDLVGRDEELNAVLEGHGIPPFTHCNGGRDG
jgi:hypothetical protein